MIPMTLADILDRWTIALIKKHVGKLDMDAEIADYEREIYTFRAEHPKLFDDWFARLLIFNARVWVFESEIRRVTQGDMNANEIVHRALATREGNGQRCVVKQEISEYLQQTKDLKTDTLAAPDCIIT